MTPSIAIIVGSAFDTAFAEKLNLSPETVRTDFGEMVLYRCGIDTTYPAWVLPRHGFPHRFLPNHINYRAQAAALQQVGCKALLINSSVGVMDANLPIYKPMLVTDLLMPENRLPDGSTCTMFPEADPHHGHLLLKTGLFSPELRAVLVSRFGKAIHATDQDVVFVYAGGPRGKTSAENRMWAQLGGQVNSMTLAPEVVLANELEIPTAAVVVGHKYSVPGVSNPAEEEIANTLAQARNATEEILISFLTSGEPVPFTNEIYRFSHE
ncbi:MAG: 5'-methylthioadenosine phosphorylase [Cyclonatronaceae bacterium]